ncbi:MAG: hypothetical protein HQL53_03715 [Magnetococcales bacterium]|nr:hypothetical protein [Magnetococcales bacterium]
MRKQTLYSTVIGTLLATVLAVSPNCAVADKSLEISSDRLEMNDTRQVAVFIGRVRVAEGQMKLNADRMEVYYARGHGGQQMGRVREIRARGHVKLVQGKNHGVARVARYDVGNQLLWLEGSPKRKKGGNAKLRFGDDRLEGRKIRMEMGADRRIRKVRVVGSSTGRVKVSISGSGIMETSKGKDGRPKVKIKDIKTSVKPKSANPDKR